MSKTSSRSFDVSLNQTLELIRTDFGPTNGGLNRFDMAINCVFIEVPGLAGNLTFWNIDASWILRQGDKSLCEPHIVCQGLKNQYCTSDEAKPVYFCNFWVGILRRKVFEESSNNCLSLQTGQGVLKREIHHFSALRWNFQGKAKRKVWGEMIFVASGFSWMRFSTCTLTAR